MVHTCSNIWDLGGDWAGPIYWYARGVAVMKGRPLAEPTSWGFFAAMHGINPRLWQALGYLSSTDPIPADDVIETYWEQCQHGSWYFLPWHRGYVLALEAIIRAAVIDLGGPADWALPYWNYFKTGQAALPHAFTSPQWPDGQDENPLFVPQRYGSNNDGNVFVPLSEVNLKGWPSPILPGLRAEAAPASVVLTQGSRMGARCTAASKRSRTTGCTAWSAEKTHNPPIIRA